MSEPLIRPARPGDEAAIHAAHMRSINEICVKDHGPEEIRGWGNRPLGDRWIESIKRDSIWVVELEGKIHGHAFLRLFEENGLKQGYVHGLYLTPEVLGKGLGTQLARLMLERARAFGAERIRLDSTLTAQGFYRRMGFVERGPIQSHLIGGFPVRAIPMELVLPHP